MRALAWTLLVHPWEMHANYDYIFFRRYIFPPTRFPQFGGINEERLLIELRKDPGYNDRVTSVRFPAGPPPRACEILPAFEGSGGRLI